MITPSRVFRVRNPPYALFLFSSFALLTLSMSQMTPLVVDIDDVLGLLDHFPPLYWLGLSLVVATSLVAFLDDGVRSDSLFLSLLVLLGLYMVIVPALAQENLRNWMSPGARILLATGHLDTNSPLPFPFYRAWPGSHIILVALALVSGVEDLMTLAKFGPVLTYALFVLLAYVLAKQFDQSPQRRFGFTWLAATCLWMPWTFNANAVFLAFLAYLLLGVLLSSRSSGSSFSQRAMQLVVFAQLTTAHLLTSLQQLVVLLFLGIRDHRYLRSFLVFCVAFGLWYLYLSPAMLAIGAQALLAQIINFDLLFVAKTTKFAPASQLAQIVNGFRLVFIGILGVPAAVALLRWMRGGLWYREFNHAFWICYLLPAVLVSLVQLTAEFFERAYLYAVLPAVGIIFLSVSNRKVIAALILVGMVAFLPARYGSEANWATYTSELRGAEFLATKTFPRQIFYDYIYYAWYFDPELANVPAFGDEPWVKQQSVDPLLGSDHIVVSRLQTNTFLYYYGTDYVTHWLNESENRFRLVYDSYYFKIFARNANDVHP